MFEFKSKPIAINGDTVLCQDGSIWQKSTIIDSKTHLMEYQFELIAVHTPKTRKEGVPGGYSEQFDEFWSTWRIHINNTCSKHDAYTKWAKLSAENKDNAVSFIEQYSKSNTKHEYLKRPNTYLSGKIWESADHISNISSKTMPEMTNIIWSKKIFNKDTGITDKAKDQVNLFGMSKEEAWRLINES